MRLWIAFAALLAMTAPAAAQLSMSATTDLDLTACTVVATDDFGTTWACPGYKGIPVMVRESDRRFSVSFGLESTREKAAKQSLPVVNRLGETIEWRLAPEAGALRPFAAILRYRLGTEGAEAGEVLVVTRLEPGTTCQVAFVEATGDPDALSKAEEAADTLARKFDCDDEPRPFGPFTAW